jgi:cell division septation protein DedD
MAVRTLLIGFIVIALISTIGCGGKEEKEAQEPEVQQPVEEPAPQQPAVPEVKFENPYIQKKGYTIQIYSFKDYSKAVAAATKFTNRGYKAYIEDVEVVGEGIYHRVRIGSYASLNEARRVGRDLKARYGVNYWVDRD